MFYVYWLLDGKIKIICIGKKKRYMGLYLFFFHLKLNGLLKVYMT